MKDRWGLTAAAAVLTMATASTGTHAHAQAKKSVEVTSEQILQRMDRNGDGKVGEEEFRNAMMRRFAAADADRDGVLSADEVPTHSVVVQNSESTGGQVKLEDYSASLKTVFDQYDTDRDGQLAGDELEKLAQARSALKEAK
ncbi:MAG TPA: EF-hand domain-containing protein [Luteimonas sp.]|nr:EF-hand domain-containing protein [Luteimonas sp.]